MPFDQLPEIPPQIDEMWVRIANVRGPEPHNQYNNQLRKLPDSLRKLQDLRCLLFFGNQIIKIPDWTGTMPQLHWLGLDKNKIRKLPPGLFKSQSIRLLTLSHNQIAGLPEDIGNMQQLEHLTRRKNKKYCYL
jgi:leucine-rich repeat protein SHOC2